MNQIFKYRGNDITFLNEGDNVMVNATEMAKSFRKLPSDWLRQKSTKEFLMELYAVKGIPITVDLVKIVQGGNEKLSQGTWMHQDVAHEYARWLSPRFAIWCNDRIKELLKYGITATPKTIESIIANPDNAIRLLTALKEEREIRQLAEMERNKALQKAEAFQTQLQLVKPKVDFAEAVMGSKETIDIGQAAKILELPFGRNTLFLKLRSMGIFFKDRNEPKQSYVERGYFKLKEMLINSEGNIPQVYIKVLVTQRGLNFLRKVLVVKLQVN